MPLVVVKLGSSSVVTPDGEIDTAMMDKLVAEVAAVHAMGRQVVVVTSGAIAAGLPRLGWSANRPSDDALLRAAAAVGQTTLMRSYEQAFAGADLLCGQVLLAPTDFMLRRRYLKSRGTLRALLDVGVVPIVNENDAIADDEIRFGDNDRLGALVAHLIEAQRLVLLTDTAGLFTADPRTDDSASLIEEIVAIDAELEAAAGGAGTAQSTGGMASKLAAAKIATWSGVETTIASARREHVIVDAITGVAGVGTVFRARDGRLGARKLWVAFALPSSGTITVDAGARRALEERQGSLLPAGIVRVEGAFDADAAVEVTDETGEIFAKGQVSWGSEAVATFGGLRTGEIPDHLPDAVIHRDHLVLLPR